MPSSSRISRRRFIAHGAAATLGATAFGRVPRVRAAEEFPTHPLRMIIPYPPGGAGDIVGRLVGVKLSQVIGQSVVIDNKGGGAQVIATELTAQAPPDGYTVFLCSTTHAINPSLRKLPYDTLKDFTPITLVASSPLVFVVHPALGVSNIQELVAYARKNPGRINYGSSGPGTGGHLSVELLCSMAGVKMTHVPYKGAAPALTALLANQVQLVCTSPLPAMPHVKAGEIKALALTSAKRSALWPDIPTVAESGYPGYQSTLWYALLGPANIPAPIVARLHDAMVTTLRSPEIADALHKQGAEAIGNTPAELQAFLGEEVQRWGGVIADAHIVSTE
ncbi:MAG: tripartite tricarboxylate transporter substrate binding protein [Proteobacteria bacterium]|nr:tripartite tricarboxylate transporter substrate binding protein [Pseudomonadota bacterium]